MSFGMASCKLHIDVTTYFKAKCRKEKTVLDMGRATEYWQF